jgi:dTDP-4-dehydrorhamnose 3,5-epimerase-like enzyme
MLNSIDSIKVIELPRHVADNGELVVMEGWTHVPFAIARVFAVMASVGAVRGQHAHRECAQFLTCPSGGIEVDCEDGASSATYILSRANVGLLIPPGIWAQQRYMQAGSVLMVLCDRPYEAHDYIRDFEDFKKYRGIGRGK